MYQTVGTQQTVVINLAVTVCFLAFRPCETISPCHVGGRTAILGNGLKFLKSFATRIRLGGSSHLVSPSGLFSPPPPPAKPDFSLAFPWRYCPGPSGGSPGSWMGALPRLAALLLVLAASLAVFAVPLGVPGEAQAQTVTTFISNTGQADSGSSSLSNATYYYAQRFTTGSNPGGYSLSEVVVQH